MDPILKWPGGKRGELALILPLAPTGVRRIIEPFAGGAAVALAAEPPEIWLNDAEPALIDFYRRVGRGTPRFRTRLTDLAAAFARARGAARALAPEIEARRIDEPAAARRFARALARAADPWRFGATLQARAEASLRDKHRRLTQLAARAPIPLADRQEQLATALLAAFYTSIRDDFDAPDPDAQASAWWFLRELCYGSMFRYNRAGHFNIPYGGASYNDRDLAAKAALLGSAAIRRRFAGATLTALDFRTLFEQYGDGEAGDWLFLDPPYDSDFSAYADRPFGRADQEALATRFALLPRDALLVIGRTPFTERLYRRLARGDRRITIQPYDHRYGYNVRGRNERAVSHLAIANYPLPTPSRRARSRSR